MNGNQTSADACKHHLWIGKCVSWSAVVAGAFVGLGIMFLLNIFSVAIGLSVFPTTDAGGLALAVGGLIGAIIGSFAAMFVAGWVSGYLGRPFCMKRNLGVLYGFITWSLIIIATALLATTIGHYIVSYVNFIANPASFSGNGADAVAILTPQARSGMVINITANNIVVNVLVLFALFYISALGACFGGHYGMTTRCRSEDNVDCGCCPPKKV